QSLVRDVAVAEGQMSQSAETLQLPQTHVSHVSEGEVDRGESLEWDEVLQPSIRDPAVVTEVQGYEFGQWGQFLQPVISHARAVESQCGQVLERGEALEPGVTDIRRVQVEFAERRERGEVLEVIGAHLARPEPDRNRGPALIPFDPPAQLLNRLDRGVF